MLHTGYIKQDFSISIVMLLGKISAAIVAIASLRALMWLYGVSFDNEYFALFIIVVLLSLMIKGNPTDQYAERGIWTTITSVCARWLLLFAILLVLGYATKFSAIYSRRVLFTWLVVTPPIIVVFQLIFDKVISRLLMSGHYVRRVVIAGANDLGQSLATRIIKNPRLGMSLHGFFDDRDVDRLGDLREHRLLGKLQDLPDYVRGNSIDLVFIALPVRSIRGDRELLDEIHDTTASIYYVPDIFVFDLIQCQTDEIDGLPVIALCESPLRGTPGMVKRISDIMIASLVLLFSSPLLICIAIGIKLTSSGSVIFKQRRHGLDGREIIVYKFRSMTVSEDSETVRQVSRDDARVTKIGFFLRKYSLDELPQFVNVLQGRMSVVGPRPHAVAHNEEYRRLIKGYMFRHKVTPGITGLAQVRGQRGGTRTVDDMSRRVESDLEYLRNWSLALDVKIIFKTIFMVLSDKAAY